MEDKNTIAVEIIKKPKNLAEIFRIRPNLENYGKFCRRFKWQDIEKEFSWSKTGKVNMAHETIDRHAETWRKNKIALYYLDDERYEKYTFQEMKTLSDKFANVLKKYNIGKGERVVIFMPRSPEFYISLIGILKVGAIPVPLFEAFMKDALFDRMADCEACAVVTTSILQGRIPREKLPSLKYVFLADVNEANSGEISWKKEMGAVSGNFSMEWLRREDPLILHYTSGSTGKPKGIIHVQEAMLGQYLASKLVVDLHEEDIFWCTADPGWVTGTAVGFLGPWLLGSSIVIRGGRFNPAKWYETIEKLKVTVWFSAPTAFRMLMKAGQELPKKYDLSSLRYICSAGEPLNPEVIRWGEEVFGGQAIHENWWMTETGHVIIGNFPCLPVKLGSMGKPLPGVKPAIVDDSGKELKPYKIGNLVIKSGWPGMMREIWKNPEKYQSYFRAKNWFFTDDLAYKDKDGYFWFEGRADDVIKTSGERVGPFEVESKLIEHPAVAAAGVIGKPDPERGHIIKAFIQLREGFVPSEELKKEIMDFIKKELAAHAMPREIEFREKLPVTKSGKIMRRVLRAEELGLPIGDLSTLEE